MSVTLVRGSEVPLLAGPAFTLHHGAYEELSRAYHALETWAEGNGYETRDAPYDRYLNDPEKASEADLLTEALWPVH